MERTILHISWISELIWLTRLDHAKQFTIIKQNWLASIRALYVPLEFLLFFHCCNDCIVIYSYIVCNAYYILYYIWYICISYILYDSLNVAQCNPQLWASNSEISSVVQMPQICLSQDNVPTGVTETTNQADYRQFISINGFIDSTPHLSRNRSSRYLMGGISFVLTFGLNQTLNVRVPQ